MAKTIVISGGTDGMGRATALARQARGDEALPLDLPTLDPADSRRLAAVTEALLSRRRTGRRAPGSPPRLPRRAEARGVVVGGLEPLTRARGSRVRPRQAEVDF